MSDQNQDYQKLLTEIIQKQVAILGPSIAVMKAKNISGLEVQDDGTVVSIEGNPQEIVRNLVDEYVDLSGQIVKNALSSVFVKYPDLEK
jgi:hypothetical protein